MEVDRPYLRMMRGIMPNFIITDIENSIFIILKDFEHFSNGIIKINGATFYKIWLIIVFYFIFPVRYKVTSSRVHQQYCSDKCSS